ncbi:MAG: hypothetical protein WBC13_12945, partial [Dokdonella sp.]
DDGQPDQDAEQGPLSHGGRHSLTHTIHERARMIAEDLVASARRAEPEWWGHCGDKQRSDRRKRPARTVPAGKRSRIFCRSHVISILPCPINHFGVFLRRS